MKIRLFRYCEKVFSHDYDERRRTKKGRPRGGFRDGTCKNLLAPPCLKRGPEAGFIADKTIFMVWVKTLGSCQFLQEPKNAGSYGQGNHDFLV
jgi:hypothetical protein